MDRHRLPAAARGQRRRLSFVLAVVFVFIFLAALYESLTLPLAVILIVPMCLLAAMLGVNLHGSDNNILTQIGMVVLIGLAAKNAILIVEFARQAEEQLGMTPVEAAVARGTHAPATDPDDLRCVHRGRRAAGVRHAAPAPRCARRWASRCSSA